MESVTLEKVLACPDLPSLPKVALDLVELTRDPDADVAEVARLVQFDQALTAKVLKTVNSSYYGLAHPCVSLRRATAYLGNTAVRSLVLSFSLVDLTRRGGKGLDLVDYWRRCTYSAAAARRIAARTTQCDPEEAFIAALMQDVGMLTLHTAMSQEYDDVVGTIRGDHRLLPRNEKRHFGFTHADAGAGLGARWRLPARIIEPIRLHHAGDTDGADETASIVRTVSMSYRLATAITGGGDLTDLRTVYAMGERYFDLSIEEVQSLLADTSTDAHALSRLLEVKIGDQVDVARVIAGAKDVVRRHHPVRPGAEDNPADRPAEVDLLPSLSEALTTAAAANSELAIVLIAPDECPALDDCAEPAMDAVLADIGRRVGRFAGPEVTVLRTAERTLAVIIPKAGCAQAANLGEGIRARVAMAPFTLPVDGDQANAPTRLTVSVGVAAFDEATRTVFDRPEVLAAAAFRALATAQERGNAVEAFVPGARTA